MRRIRNQDACSYVRRHMEFNGSPSGSEYWTKEKGTIFARWLHKESCNLYIVYSYRYDWPMYIYSSELDVWYGNSDKFSRSTTRHMSQARPQHDVTWLCLDDMLEIHNYGPTALVQRAVGEQ